MTLRFVILAGIAIVLTSCGPNYSPDTYATNAVQQANKVEQGVVVGARDVAVSASGTVGAVTGGAAGGIAGAQLGVGSVSAFSALGGTLVGGLAGTAVEHATGDTHAFEYIVRKGNGDLVSVTQKDKTPLAIGQRVLVIAGNQARVVPDYTVNLTPSEKEKARAGDGIKAAGASGATQATSAEDPPGSETAKSNDTGPAMPPSSATASPGRPSEARTPEGRLTEGRMTEPAAASAGAPIKLTDPLPTAADPARASSTP